jgi:hypothetical protein
LYKGYFPITQGGRLTWAKYNGLDWIQKCQITMDQVFFISQALSATDIRLTATRPLQTALLPDVVFYWTFESVSPTAPFYILTAYNGNVSGRILSSKFSMQEGLANPPVAPVLVASDAPYLGSGYLVVKQTDATGSSVSALVSPNAGIPAVTSLPDIGELYLLLQNGQKSPAPLQQSDLPAVAVYGVRFEGSLSAGPRNLSYSVGSDSAVLVFQPNRAPSPRPSIVLYVDQSTQRDFLLVRTLFAPPPNPRREFHYNVDLDVDQVTCTCTLLFGYFVSYLECPLNVRPPCGAVTSLPTIGQLITSSGVLLASNSLPQLVPDCAVSYIPPPSTVGINLTTFSVRIADSYASSTTQFVVTIINRYYPPVPQSQQRVIDENTNLRVNFTTALSSIEQFRVQTSNHIVRDRPFIQITSWPRYGSIYQVGSDGKPAGQIVPNGSPFMFLTRFTKK